MILVTANEGAQLDFCEASLVGTAEIEGNVVRREGRLASMAWPVKDHWQEIPAPRLLQKIYVSVGGQESAPLSMKARDSNIYEVEEGGTLSIPLLHFRRSEFSGSLMNAKVFGKGLEGFRVEIPLDSRSFRINDRFVQISTEARRPCDCCLWRSGCQISILCRLSCVS